MQGRKEAGPVEFQSASSCASHTSRWHRLPSALAWSAAPSGSVPLPVAATRFPEGPRSEMGTCFWSPTRPMGTFARQRETSTGSVVSGAFHAAMGSRHHLSCVARGGKCPEKSSQCDSGVFPVAF